MGRKVSGKRKQRNPKRLWGSIVFWEISNNNVQKKVNDSIMDSHQISFLVRAENVILSLILEGWSGIIRMWFAYNITSSKFIGHIPLVLQHWRDFLL